MRRVTSTYDSAHLPSQGRADWDLTIVGGGFRATTFLASAPQVLGHRVTILERGDELGPGAFGDYCVATSSAGATLLKQLSYGGPFAELRNNGQVTTVAGCQKPVRTEMLASALREMGRVITGTLGVPAVRLRTRVTQINLTSTASPVALHLEGGDVIHTRHALLATGRRERPHPELEPWRRKVMLSSAVISRSGRPLLEETLLALGQRPIVIAGCSHSAMSTLQTLLEVTAQLGHTRAGYRRPKVVVLQRSLARLMYENQAQALAEQIPGREQPFDPNHDVCPVTGIVFRDSGLRHGSKVLYCDLWAGNLPDADIVRVTSLQDAADLLNSAGLVVQALGYHGSVPDIVLSGQLIRREDSDERLLADDDGAAIIRGRIFENLSVLRVEPTPRDRRDNSAFGSDLYRRLAARLERQLGALTGNRGESP